MLSRILGNHSQILGLRELHYFGDLCEPTAVGRLDIRALTFLAARIFSRQARDVWGSDPTELELSKARELCESLAPEQRTGYGVFAAALARLASGRRQEHRVRANAAQRLLCARAFWKTCLAQRFIHVVRDPRAVLASQKNRWKLH